MVRRKSDRLYISSKSDVRMQTLERLVGVCKICVLDHLLQQRTKLIEAGHLVVRITLVLGVIIVKMLVNLLKCSQSNFP